MLKEIQLKLGCVLFIVFMMASAAASQVTGPCSDCHTMHNSQNNLAMTFDSSATPNSFLLRGTCLGCHAQGGSSRIVDGMPQVSHIDATDLAAGNFAYIWGGKGSGADDAKGHNVIDFGYLENVLEKPPGGGHAPLREKLTCAGLNGCHGSVAETDALISLSGAHHEVSSVIDGRSVGTSYRFIDRVVGGEIDDWENRDSSHHNEYHGHKEPYSGLLCTNCHSAHHGAADGLPIHSTISDFCTKCHWKMHDIDTAGDGIWIRHPSDIIIPDAGEYASYTTYNIDAPVGREIVPAVSGGDNNIVTPGTDIVTCLSCHKAHGSDYPDILRWDYTAITAGGGESSSGCFICHSTKDN